MDFTSKKLNAFTSYKNMLPLLCSNLLFRSLDFFIRAFFCASSKRLTLRSCSRSNGLLSWGLLFSSDALLFSFFWWMSMRDSDLFDSWKKWGGRGSKVLKNINNIQKIQIERLKSGRLKIWEKEDSLVTVYRMINLACME